jgi:DNA-binding NarL/FixJ family response regulator
MDDFTYPVEPAQGLQNGLQNSPVLVIIAQHVLARTCILNILKRELTGFEIVEMETASGLNWLSGRDIRLIALTIGDQPITDPSIENSLALLAKSCPNAAVALLSNRDDDATASAAMQRGVRGFFPISIPVEVAIAGLRLVLAGGVYRPLPIVAQNGASSRKAISECPDAPELFGTNEGNGATRTMPEKAMVDLTPREQHVLEALQLGLPNKLIAVRLNLSENTVKMHIQRIMRKCSAHNRTEAVVRWSRRANGHAQLSRARS